MPVRGETRWSVFRRFLFRLAVGANVMAALLLLLCGLSTAADPAEWPRVALFGLGFPVLWGLNLTFVFLWAVFCVRFVWIPLAAMLPSFSYIYDYCPLNWPEQHPEGALKMITYNTANFGQNVRDSLGRSPVVEYLAASDADIICLQESFAPRKKKSSEVDKLMAAAGYHTPHLDDGHPEYLQVYTRLPVLSAERVVYEEWGNGSIALKLLFEGDTVLVVNNHFESYKLTQQDKQTYKELLRDPESGGVEQKSRALVDKMAGVSRMRGPQVDSVLRYIDRSGVQAVVACGDFNDPPVSYVCHRMASRLTSAYRQSGSGFGWTFNQKGFYFRIDHIFVSDYWQTWETHVDKSAPWSDHYPLVTWLKKRKK